MYSKSRFENFKAPSPVKTKDSAQFEKLYIDEIRREPVQHSRSIDSGTSEMQLSFTRVDSRHTYDFDDASVVAASESWGERQHHKRYASEPENSHIQTQPVNNKTSKASRTYPNEELKPHRGATQVLKRDEDMTAEQPPYASFGTKRGKLVTFYRNGDPHYKGLSASVNSKDFMSFETLLVWLNEKIPTTAGVRCIFRIPEGRIIRDVTEFKPGGHYVVSSVRKLIRNIDYGNTGLMQWKNKPPSAKVGLVRKDDIRMIKDYYDENDYSSLTATSSRVVKPQRTQSNPNKPRVITIISNTHRSSREKVIINPNSKQNFEDMIFDFTNLLIMSKPPVQTLYTAYPPYKRVCSFSQLLRDFRDYDSFIACGREFMPVEIATKKREAPPSSNSSEDAHAQHTSPVLPPIERKPRKQPKRVAESNEDSRYQSHEDKNGIHETRPEKPYNVQPIIQKVQPVNMTIRGKNFSLYPPSSKEFLHKKLPEKTLKVEWIYGFNSGCFGSKLLVLPNGWIAYTAGNAAVLLDAENNRQRHYTEHNAPLTCIEVHPTKAYIVTGQTGLLASSIQAHVRVWDAENLGTYITLGENLFQTTVTSLAFSQESQGTYLLVVDGVSGGHRQTMYIYDWHNRRLVTKSKTAREPVRQAVFHPDDDTTIISIGRQHIHFWRIFHDESGESRILRDKKSGLFQDEIPDDVLTLGFDLVGNVITGDTSGRLQVWVRDEEDAFVCRSLNHLHLAHKDAITSLRLLGDGTLLSTSANSIRAWDTLNDYSLVKERIVNEPSGRVVTIAVKHPRSADGRLIIGTSGNCLYEGSLQDKFTGLVNGHAPVVGTRGLSLSTHPREHSFVTAGADRHVSKWSTLQRRLLWTVNVDVACTCVTYHPRGHLVLIGTPTGRFIALHSDTGLHALSCQISPSDQPVGVIRYSSDAKMLALGCEDGNVYLFLVEDEGFVYRKYKDGSLKGHSAPVVQLDWSVDNRVIRSLSEDMDLKFWSAETLLQVDAGDVNDVRFATENCIVSYSHIAAWMPYRNSGKSLTCSSKSSTADKLCVGDDNGYISLYKFPPHPDQAKGISIPALVSSLHETAFTFDDSYLISTGKENATFVQWAVTDRNPL